MRDVILPGLVAARAVALPTSPSRQLAVRNVATLLAAGLRATLRTSCPKWQIAPSASPAIVDRSGHRTPTSTRSTTSSSISSSSARGGATVADPRTRRRRRSRGWRPRGAGQSACSTCMLRTGPYGDAFGASPDGLTLAVLEVEPARASISGALDAAAPRGAADAVRQDRARRPSRSSRRSRALRAAVSTRSLGRATRALSGAAISRSNNSWTTTPRGS